MVHTEWFESLQTTENNRTFIYYFLQTNAFSTNLFKFKICFKGNFAIKSNHMRKY